MAKNKDKKKPASKNFSASDTGRASDRVSSGDSFTSKGNNPAAK